MIGELLEVGDKLHVTSVFGISWFKITRVTKTLAISKRSDGYELRFKRVISHSMSHPSQQWDSNTYTVERKQK